jgi:putative ubiquitin-RnfH superfamily antitoxin RatB of RatAB toxin-antitoxin module
MTEMLRIQVCYARPDSVFVQELSLAPGITVEQAIRASDLSAQEPDLDWKNAKVGVFGKLRPLEAMVRDGDRIEIYRPLTADPKDARRRRVAKQQRQSKGQ